MDICEKLICHSCEEGKCLEVAKSEKRQIVYIEYGGRTPLYDALPSCDHKIVDGDNWSGIKCAKCGGWYCA